jgi:DNA polymerase I-like protein with 3'-5' exonuclease and polymerase domains
LFIPAEGQLFFSIDYSAIELVTLAKVCLHRYGESRLAEVLRAGQDPHGLTAASMYGMKPAKFLAMKKRDTKEFKRLRAAAKAVNFGVPGGLGKDRLVDYARDVFGVTMTVEEAAAFRTSLIDDTYPELRKYLREEADIVHTLTGRVRSDVGYTEGKNTPFSGLAADGAKQAMFALTAAGFRLVAFIHDEFVIELPEDDDHSTRAVEIEKICVEAMQTVVGDLPVKCEYALMRRWSKDAETARDKDGRLIPWEPAS